MKIGYLRNLIDPKSSKAEKFKALGKNTGNLVFREALQRLFDPFNIPYTQQEFIAQCDKVILTDLIWIKENTSFDYLEKIVDKYSISFIPMSIGLQNKTFDLDFRLSEQVVRLLKKLEERAVLGVRGEYSAMVLRRYGIKNISIIGCPSMYYWNNQRLKIKTKKSPVHVSANFRSFSRVLTETEKDFLAYCAQRDMCFIEQTGPFSKYNVKDEQYFKHIDSWMQRRSILPCELSEWSSALKGIDFSLGGRFHGNVVALWNNIKALFMVSDSRTREMIELFHLPFIELGSFDKEKSIEYYYEKADYTDFNRNYKKLYKNFLQFCQNNGLQLSEKAVKLSFEYI